MSRPQPVLQVRDLSVQFQGNRGGWFRPQPYIVQAVNEVSLDVWPAETWALLVSLAAENRPWHGPFLGWSSLSRAQCVGRARSWWA